MPVFLDGIDLDFSDYTIDGHGAPVYSSYIIDDVWIDFISLEGGMNLQVRVIHETTGKQLTPSGANLKELIVELSTAMDKLDMDAKRDGEVEELTGSQDWWTWAEEAVRHIFNV